MKRFKDMLVENVGPTILGASDLKAIASACNPFPNKENPRNNQGLGHGKGSRDSPIGLSRMEQSCE
jgi:hypothetical protein